MMQRIKVEIKGIAPLLMHKFSVEAATELEGKIKKRKTGPPDPKDEAEAGAYRLEPLRNAPLWQKEDAPDGLMGKPKGQLCLPGEHFYQTMVRSASGFQVKGQGKKTYKDAVKGSVTIEPDFVGLVHPESGDQLFDYEIDKRPAKIQTSRVIRCRPKLVQWHASFDLVILDEKAIDPEVVNSILAKAGESTGVGDYRPRFGRFMIEKFKPEGKDDLTKNGKK